MQAHSDPSMIRKAGLTVLPIKESAFHPGKDAPACAPHPETVETRRARGFFSDERGRDDRVTFDHQVGKSLDFFEQQRNEKTACARFIGALYFEARAESRMRPEANSDAD
jgi:hypothetical protein